jgi:plasmid stabilization system protein ParE
MRGKRKLTWSPAAREQWKEILRFYTKRNGSAAYSRRLNKKLLAVLRMVQRWPHIGEATDGDKNYRRQVVAYYAVFYRITDNGIEVAEIRDGRRGDD